MPPTTEKRYQVLVGINVGCTAEHPEGRRIESGPKWLKASAIGSAADVAVLLGMGAIEPETPESVAGGPIPPGLTLLGGTDLPEGALPGGGD